MSAQQPAFHSVRPGSLWCWESLNPDAREDVRVTATRPDDGGWVKTEMVRSGESHWNELSRFIEAAVLMEPAP